MQENMVIELQRGNQIDFGELGKFRLQLTSEGAATAAEFILACIMQLTLLVDFAFQ